MSKKVRIGNITIGGGERIAVQSMATFKTSSEKALAQAVALSKAGCDILRFSVTDFEDAKAFGNIKKSVDIPLCADIHFDYRLAVAAVNGGADKIRINPGNVGSENGIREIAAAVKAAGIPVRVGSNGGSMEKEFLSKYGKNEIALAESALKEVALLEKYGVYDIVVSVKASSPALTVKAYEYVAKKTDYPLHIGVTEAGTEYNGVIKNSVAIGALLFRGIGDTIRVSLSADPLREIKAAKAILSAVGKENYGAEVIACPTCGRCEWDCMAFAEKTERFLEGVGKPLKVAVMGCVVNGPGEARDADIGIAGGKDCCMIFVKGEPYKKVKKEDAEAEFFAELKKCIL